MTMIMRISFGLLALSLALAAQVCLAHSHHPLLLESNMLRLSDVLRSPKSLRCNQFVQTLREIMNIPSVQASGAQLLTHAATVLSRSPDAYILAKKMRKCAGRSEILEGGAKIVDELKDKAMRKLGLDEPRYYGERFGERIGGEFLDRTALRGDRYAERLHHEKRQLERILESRAIDLAAQKREIGALRQELHELRMLASGRAYETTARIIDAGRFEQLRLGHEAALQREHLLRKTVRELEEQLRYGSSPLVRPGLVGVSEPVIYEARGHDHAKIWDPVEQALILASHLNYNEYEGASARCYKYYLLFSYPEEVSKKTIRTIANLQIKVRTMKMFFKLLNRHYLPELLRTAHRLSESLEESVRRIGHEMRGCLVEADEYVRIHRNHFEDDLVERVVGLASSSEGSFEGRPLYNNGLLGDVAYETSSHHRHHLNTLPGATGTTTTSTSASATGAGTAAAAAAGAAAAVGASAGASAAAGVAAAAAASDGSYNLRDLPSIEAMERHRI